MLVFSKSDLSCIPPEIFSEVWGLGYRVEGGAGKCMDSHSWVPEGRVLISLHVTRKPINPERTYPYFRVGYNYSRWTGPWLWFWDSVPGAWGQ